MLPRQVDGKLLDAELLEWESDRFDLAFVLFL
jgi:hypothetical protein